jgi:glutathione S-transferase
MTANTLPVLYSFRRCPYAMRARMALVAAGIAVELREVVLKDKPACMLAASPKGTVPVLIAPSGEVIDESLDIMLWALREHDPQHWLAVADRPAMMALVDACDAGFKPWLDRYKYFDRYPDHPQPYYREQAEVFLAQCEARLASQAYLMGASLGFADAAIFPFIRQFANVDMAWFEASPYSRLQRWLGECLGSALFAVAMHKYKPWQTGDLPVLLR